MNRRSILAAYKKKSSHLQTGVTGFKSGNLFKIETTDLTRFSRRKSHTNQHTIFTLVSGNPTGNSDFFFLRESTNSCLKTVFVFTYQPSLGCGVACWILTIHMFLTDFS